MFENYFDPHEMLDYFLRIFYFLLNQPNQERMMLLLKELPF